MERLLPTPFRVGLTIQIDDQIIQCGAITLLACDVFIPYAGAVRLK